MQEEMMDMIAIGDSGQEKEAPVAESGADATGDEFSRTECHEEAAASLEKPAISDLQAVAGAFNEAFNSALYELELSRRTIQERTSRISELDEAVQSIRSALDDETGKARMREEEYTRETGELMQRLQDTESERNILQEKVCEHERALNERDAEISGLLDRANELSETIEQNAAATRCAENEFAAEKEALNNKLNDLQGLYEEAGKRIDGLLAEAESRNNEVSQLGQQVAELQDEVNTQTEAMRLQSESHATDREELNACVAGVKGELETLQALHADLQAHSEKLENLNHALHESSFTEKVVHRQELEEKSAQIELLRSRLESTGESPEGQQDDACDTEVLKNSMRELEARLNEAMEQNQELGIKAERADKLEGLNRRLRVALRKTREYMAQNGEESQVLASLQEQVAELQSELEAACSRENDLAGKLHAYETAAQGVMNPEAIASEIDAMHSAREDSTDSATELKVELEKLASELSASEEKCRQLETALATTADAGEGRNISPDNPDVQQSHRSPDRAHFIEQLDVLLSRQDRSEEDHSLMYVLLDNFIMIRDEIGVVESESVVRDVSRIIEADCNMGDIMARFGDCTFALLCTNTTADEAEERAGRIRAEVESRIFEYSGRSLVTTTSIGICSLRRNDANPEKIISRVDLACDAARLSGGNRVIVSSAIADEIDVSGNGDQHCEMVHSTLSENRIKVYYQPISGLRGQSGNHFEVLVRLVDKSGDMILPGEFFAMAEGVGSANEVDRFIIDKALKEMSENNDGMTRYYIKLTRQSVADKDLADWIMYRIDEYGVKPEQLVFEIAENILKSDLKDMASLSRALHAIGCKIAIEHYRMSTNLQHLMHVHIDYLKIDKELVGSVDKRGESLAKVAAIIELATKNNYITIAEGVESPECLAMIWELGISMAQGYFVQVPSASPEYINQDIITCGKDEAENKAIFNIS